MSTELYRVRRKRRRRDLDPAVHRRPEFHEAPGESAADGVSEAFIRGSDPAPSSVVSALYRADDGTRERMLYRMQNDIGNQYVQRVATAAIGPAAPPRWSAIQAIRTGVPGGRIHSRWPAGLSTNAMNCSASSRCSCAATAWQLSEFCRCTKVIAHGKGPRKC